MLLLHADTLLLCQGRRREMTSPVLSAQASQGKHPSAKADAKKHQTTTPELGRVSHGLCKAVAGRKAEGSAGRAVETA